MLFSLQAFASDAAIVMTENPSRLYMVHLSSPAPRLELLAVNTTGSRPIWNNITNEIMWGEGSNIIKLSIDGGDRKLTSINGRFFLPSRINPYIKYIILFMGHRQTVQIQIRRYGTWCLIRTLIVCFTEFSIKI